MRHLFLLCILAVSNIVQPHRVAAMSPLEQTKSTLEQARAIIDGPKSHDEQLTELGTLLKGFLDTDDMGRSAMAGHWTKLSVSQQKEFLGLFRELFQRTYVQKLLLFDKPDFGYGAETITGTTAVVETKILTPKDEFAVNYTLRTESERWLVTDIRIEEMSLTRNFERQLDRLLTKSGIDEVLSRMRKKYGPGGKGEDDGL